MCTWMYTFMLLLIFPKQMSRGLRYNVDHCFFLFNFTALLQTYPHTHKRRDLARGAAVA